MGKREGKEVQGLIPSTTSQSGRETEFLRTAHVKGKVKAQAGSTGSQLGILSFSYTHTVLKVSFMGRHMLIHGSTQIP